MMRNEEGDARLESLARQLGARAAEQVDVDRVARQVVEQLRTQPEPRATWIQPAWLRIAAMVVVLVGTGVVVGRLTTGQRPVVSQHAAHYVADDLNDLSADELRDVLTSFDEIISTDSAVVPDSSSDLRGLDAQQLREVLRAVQGEVS
jgi:hypothetical protein